MENKLIVNPAPHITSFHSTLGYMCAILLALVPTTISGIIASGINALYVILVSVVSAYLFDLLMQYFLHKKIDWLDISSVVTGLVSALILPATVPLYLPIIANFFAIIIFKGCFGGLGNNIFNPAGIGRVILGLLFSALTLQLYTGTGLGGNIPSPLSYFEVGDYSSVTIRTLFFGTAPAAIGTGSILCILITGILLLCFKITDYVIPVCAIVSFVVTTWIGAGATAIIPFIFSGSFLFVTLFMLTDPTSSPLTEWGKLFYGLIFGIIAGIFRVNFVLGETSVFVALITVNLLAGILDKIFAPHPIGVRRRIK